jgi:hypothetical protein
MSGCSPVSVTLTPRSDAGEMGKLPPIGLQ